jgi:hypothetical protein
MACYDDCTHSARRPTVVVRESGRTAVFRNENREKLTLTKFDGCVDCDGRRADYVLNHPDQRRVIIELKGRHLSDARDQISDTFKFLSQTKRTGSGVSALIVCSKVPLGVSTVQRLTVALKSVGVVKVKVKSREWHGLFADLF